MEGSTKGVWYKIQARRSTSASKTKKSYQAQSHIFYITGIYIQIKKFLHIDAFSLILCMKKKLAKNYLALLINVNVHCVLQTNFVSIPEKIRFDFCKNTVDLVGLTWVSWGIGVNSRSASPAPSFSSNISDSFYFNFPTLFSFNFPYLQ